MGCIREYSNATDTNCDEMLIFAVATLKNTNTSEANVEELIKLISDKNIKVSMGC